MRIGPIALFFGGLAGCGSAGAEDVGTIAQPIVNGVSAGASAPQVVRLVPTVATPGGYFCSGVLIAPSVVLTARHCVSRVEASPPMNCSSDGTTISGGSVAQDYPADKLGVIVGDGNTIRAKGTNIFRPAAKTLCNADISLMVLEQPITDVPIVQLRLDAPVTQDETVTATGWGLSNNSTGFTLRQRTDVPIVDLGPFQSTIDRTLGPNEFSIGESTCEGDSGGPIVDSKTGAVLGVVSRGGNLNPAAAPAYVKCVDAPGYKTVNLITRIGGFKELIVSALSSVGAEPWVEGGPDPRKAKAGEACTADDACSTAVCGTNKVCAAACLPNGMACGAGLTCQANACQPAPSEESSGCSASSRGSASNAWILVWGAAIAAMFSGRRKRAV